MKNLLFVLGLCAAVAAGCASSPPPAAAVPPPAPVAPQAVAPAPAPPAALPPGSQEMSFGLPDEEDWHEADRHAFSPKGWTADMVIRNDKIRATFTFLSIPKTMGSPMDLATKISAQFGAHTPIMGGAEGRRASFLYNWSGAHGGSVNGKVVVLVVEGRPLEHVMIIGMWPQRSNDAALRDIDEVARTLTAAPPK